MKLYHVFKIALCSKEARRGGGRNSAYTNTAAGRLAIEKRSRLKENVRNVGIHVLITVARTVLPSGRGNGVSVAEDQKILDRISLVNTAKDVHHKFKIVQGNVIGPRNGMAVSKIEEAIFYLFFCLVRHKSVD